MKDNKIPESRNLADRSLPHRTEPTTEGAPFGDGGDDGGGDTTAGKQQNEKHIKCTFLFRNKFPNM